MDTSHLGFINQAADVSCSQSEASAGSWWPIRGPGDEKRAGDTQRLSETSPSRHYIATTGALQQPETGDCENFASSMTSTTFLTVPVFVPGCAWLQTGDSEDTICWSIIILILHWPVARVTMYAASRDAGCDPSAGPKHSLSSHQPSLGEWDNLHSNWPTFYLPFFLSKN